MTSRRRRMCYGLATKKLSPRVLSALQVWLWLLVFVFQNEFRISEGLKPGYLDYDNLPDTNFTCVGKVIGGYYADLETSCQMFHVCTIGQNNTSMDIKFLCLNGTVFDQETRVCERVDEVDCSKSEKFYSLNLELYGSTAPPLIEPEDEHSASENNEPEKSEEHLEAETERPAQEESHQELEGSDETAPEEGDYVDYTEDPPTTPHTTTTTKARTTTTATAQPKPTKAIQTEAPTTIVSQQKPSLTYGLPNRQQNPTESFYSPQEFIYRHGSQKDKTPEAISFSRQTFANDGHSPLTVTTHNIEHHVDKKPHQSIADKIFITSEAPPKEWNAHAEIQHIDKYESYESNKHIKHQPIDPRPLLMPPRYPSEAISFTLRNPTRIPQGFKPSPTTQNPHSQLQSPNVQFRPMIPQKFEYKSNRPYQSYQPSEKHEILYENQYKIPTEYAPHRHEYDHYHFDHKRSHDPEEIPIQFIMPRNAPTSHKPTEQRTIPTSSHRNLMKSPPRIIVSASASVSDSNGKKLNYTVGNIVHEVKPIVTINYDNYKESDILFDPFFLDVPKLKKSRLKRSPNQKAHFINKRETIITVENTEKEMLNDETPPEIHHEKPLSIETTVFNDTSKVLFSSTTDDETPPEIHQEKPLTIDTTSFNDMLKAVVSSTTAKESEISTAPTSTATIESSSRWDPPEYVDDNYEPYITDDIVPTEEDITSNKTKNEHKFTSQSVGTKYADVKDKKEPSQEDIESELHKMVLFHKIQEVNPTKLKKKMPQASSTPESKINKTNLIELEKELERQLIVFHQTQRDNALKKYELEMKLKKQNLQEMYSTKPEELRMETISSSQMSKPPSNLIKSNYQTPGHKPTVSPFNADVDYKLVKISNTPFSKKLSVRFSCNEKTFYKFYADQNSCRTFHLCSPGYSKSEYVDMLFECDLGLHFDKVTSTCIDIVLSDCKP